MDSKPRGRWIKFYVSILDAKSHYPDGLRRAFDDLLLISAKQFEPGRFESEGILRASLGKRARFLPRLIAEGDIVRNADGSLSTANYDHYQAPMTNAERQQLSRDRRRWRNDEVTRGVTNPVTQADNAIRNHSDIDIDGKTRALRAPDYDLRNDPERMRRLGVKPAGPVPLGDVLEGRDDG